MPQAAVLHCGLVAFKGMQSLRQSHQCKALKVSQVSRGKFELSHNTSPPALQRSENS